jgi:hypothetical protein
LIRSDPVVEGERDSKWGTRSTDAGEEDRSGAGHL